MNTKPSSLSSSGFQVPADYFDTLATRTLCRMQTQALRSPKTPFYYTLRLSLAAASVALIILIATLPLPSNSPAVQAESNDVYLSVISRNVDSYVLIHELCQEQVWLGEDEESIHENDPLLDEIILGGTIY